MADMNRRPAPPGGAFWRVGGRHLEHRSQRRRDPFHLRLGQGIGLQSAGLRVYVHPFGDFTASNRPGAWAAIVRSPWAGRSPPVVVFERRRWMFAPLPRFFCAVGTAAVLRERRAI